MPSDFMKVLGQSISDKGVPCPRCNDSQNLYSTGDYEHILFCPHCELEVELKLTNSYKNAPTGIKEVA